MGDCRIKIVISKTLCETQSTDNESDSTRRETTLSSAEMYSSDTTVRELIERHVDLWKIVSSDNNNNKGDATLWDCTLHPPKDITSWPFVEYPDLQGPKSLTLHRAGWFPSATLVCFPVGVSPTGYKNSVSGDDPYADVQYNKKQHISSGDDTQTGRSVQFKDQSLDKTSKPSEVMASVSRRFDDEDEAVKARRKTEQENKSQQRTKYLEQKYRQHERAAKLDQKIAALEELEDKGSKKKKSKDGVSAQVLRMLVKSRATGDDRLKIQDRFYFQCLLLHPDGVDGDENGGTASVSSSKEYRYFSSQDTFARIAGSFDLDKKEIPNSSTLLTEVLCRIPPSSRTNLNSNYRRFPMTMRIYEAISQGFLNDQIDTLIVRCFKDRDGATALSVNDSDEEVETFQDLDEEDSKMDTNQDNGENVRQTEPTESLDVPMTDSTSSFQDLKLSETIQGLGSDGKKESAKKAKSSSAATIKIRQMKMKSKASGDSKRIKMDDRFYLDIITVDNDGEDGNYRASSGHYFLSRKDPLERIIQYLHKNNLKSQSIIDWDFLVVSEGEDGTSSFRRIPDTSRTMDELEADGDLNIKSFDRLILKYVS
mmetsp:Transcript_34852/g.84309  ORF Transcript_34852/g.84309 Transcript_34852/m.84309 type:complete len:595 (+) Transcript_34852:219-2003(+)